MEPKVGKRWQSLLSEWSTKMKGLIHINANFIHIIPHQTQTKTYMKCDSVMWGESSITSSFLTSLLFSEFTRPWTLSISKIWDNIIKYRADYYINKLHQHLPPSFFGIINWSTDQFQWVTSTKKFFSSKMKRSPLFQVF